MRRVLHSFRATPAVVHGRRYASKLEARYARYLHRCKETGTVLMWIDQPKFWFPCGNTYRADFLVFWENGEAQLVDVKGKETREFRIKQRLMAQHYPEMPLEVVWAKDVP